MADRHDIADDPLDEAPALFDGKGLIASLWRHRLLFLVVFLGIVGLSVVASVVLPARFLATASVIVAEADPATRTSDVWAQKQGDPADLESQIMILRSGRLLKMALSQPGAYEAAIAECRNAGDSCANLAADAPQLADKVAEHFSIAAVGRSRVLSVSYNSALPETAMTIANALVTAYLEDQRGNQSSSREVAAKWLWQEIADLDKEIRDRVTKIEAFRRQNGLVQGATASISSESLTAISQQLAAAEQAKAQAQARLDAIRDMRNGQDISSSPMALENRTVADLKQQIASLGNQLAASATILGPRHPQRRMLEASMGLLQRQMNAEIDRISTSAAKDFEAASSLVTALQAQVGKAKDTAANALSDESSIEGMVRDVEAKRQLYTQLYQRASELESERRSLNGGARLVSLAELPTRPYFPKKTPMVAAGLALGLFLAAATCVLWDRFGAPLRPLLAFRRKSGSTRPEKPEDRPLPLRSLAEASPRLTLSRNAPVASERLRILASLPPLPAMGVAGQSGGSLETIVRRSMLSPGFQQDVRKLAVDLIDTYEGRPLLFLPAGNASRSAAFACMLAAQALVRAGLNVLVIECAPGNCEFAEAFGIPAGHATLGDVLTGRVEPSEAVSRTRMPGLHVIPGEMADLDIVSGGRLNGLVRLLDWASPYDMVLLSGPALADPQSPRALKMLAAHVELSALICAEDDRGSEERLDDAGALVTRCGIPALGGVLLPAVGDAARPVDPLARLRRKSA